MSTSDYYKSLPAKRMGSGALFFDNADRILILKPNYKETWEIPGGVVELNESPRTCAEREIREEIGIERKVSQLLCVDYQDPYDIKTESIMFIFDGGVLTASEITGIKLGEKEITEHKWVSLEEAKTLLAPVLARRVEQACLARERGRAVYLENRELV